MNFVGVGNVLPVYAQIGDGNPSLFVRATIVDYEGNAVTGSPVNLQYISNGLYTNPEMTAVIMPNVPYVTVQCIAYTDAGYSMVAPYGIAAQVFSSKSFTGGGIDTGAPIPVVAQTADGSTNKFVLGWVYDDTNTLLPACPVTLTSVGSGLYQNNALVMPNVEYVLSQVQAYYDSGHTMPYGNFSTVALLNSAVVPVLCPFTPTVPTFKAFFARDFPYSTDPTQGVTDNDIAKALQEALCYVNRNLFCTEESYNLGVLTLAAHFLVMNLRASSQGISGTYPWLMNSKAVGNVSAGYTIPQRILDNPELSMLTQTYYGSQFLFMILPQLTGQIFSVYGRTNP